PAYLKDHVHAIRKRDILVAIDDVGFGRSSLESLIILEPDIVKIDRKYVSGISADPAKARLLKRLVKVVNSIGAELIAEGIECREELELLVEMGVPFGQGWLWGKPA
ncbi:MAG TPA: EAL domain-containing protein, partial [Candidatus Obscuribacter sp.]|nr:EAL domain-containing protein [Candidatus Obscuribacter sp.]